MQEENLDINLSETKVTRQGLIFDFIKKHGVPIAVFIITILIFTSLEQGSIGRFIVWVVAGIPFGMKFFRLRLFARGYDTGATIAIFILPYILGGLIGVPVLLWRILMAVVGLIKMVHGIVAIK